MSKGHMRSRLVLTSLALTVGVATGCADTTPAPIPRVTQPTDLPSQPTPSATTSDEPGSTSGDRGRAPKVVGTLVDLLEVPWGVDFLPGGAAVVTERISGRVLQVTPDGTLRRLGAIAAAVPEGEAGLLGVAVSPDFDSDRTLFFYLTTGTDNRVIRARLDGMTLGRPTVVLDGIPRGFIHDGGRIAFGPDGYLYVSTGETGEPALAQDTDSLAGKILRITPDGAPAPGNPDPGSPVWSLGHRNVQGLAFDGTGRLWASEFGDQTFDELNRITAGANYGWPEVEGRGGEPEYVDPRVTWSTEDASPSGLAFADGSLWMAALRGQRLWRIPLEGDTTGEPVGLLSGDYGRIRTVVTTPDGDLWVATSNRDGRGSPADEDDRILLVSPS